MPQVPQAFLLMAAADLHEAGRLVEPKPTEAEMNRAKATLKNGMWASQDPTEGDQFLPDKYNTAMAAEGIRKYEGDR